MTSSGQQLNNHNHHSNLQPRMKVQNISKFDQYKIVEHYVRLRELQQEKLANINLSEELKRKLFGFSQGYYLTNNHDPYRLIIENHPIKGRTVKTEQRYHYEMHNKYRQREMRQDIKDVSGIKDYSEEKLYMDSDIQVPFPESSDGSTPNPEFNNYSEDRLRENFTVKNSLIDEQ